MKNKADRFYFENFVEAADYSCKAADYLVECLSNYDGGKIVDMIKTMHAYEHSGDTKKHEMSAALAKAFVTPVDREDLMLISQTIDEVTDNIEEVLQRFYMDKIESVKPQAVEFSKKLSDSCHLMKDMLTEFSNFKKPAKLHEMIVEINRLEEECDKLYLAAAREVRENHEDVLDMMSWRAIYSKLEHCADACEHVGDCIDMVVMKNT